MRGGRSAPVSGGGVRATRDAVQNRAGRKPPRCSYVLELALGQQHAHSAKLRTEKRLRQTPIAAVSVVPLTVERHFADHPARCELVVPRRMAARDRVIAVRAELP